MNSLLEGHDLQTILNMDVESGLEDEEEEENIEDEEIDVMGRIIQRGQALSVATNNQIGVALPNGGDYEEL